jgi:hypothetical protein
MLLLLLLQMVSPFMDPKTKTKVEFVRTKHASENSTHRSSSWGSFSSLLGGGKTKPTEAAAAKSKSKSMVSLAADASGHHDQQQQHSCNSTSFSPLLRHYWSPYQEPVYRTLLREIGW